MFDLSNELKVAKNKNWIPVCEGITNPAMVTPRSGTGGGVKHDNEPPVKLGAKHKTKPAIRLRLRLRRDK